MKRSNRPKSIIALLSICVFLATVWICLDLKAADDPVDIIKKIVKDCEDYCSKHDDEFYEAICKDGCINGAIL
jgi:hypothetical protein